MCRKDQIIRIHQNKQEISRKQVSSRKQQSSEKQDRSDKQDLSKKQVSSRKHFICSLTNTIIGKDIDHNILFEKVNALWEKPIRSKTDLTLAKMILDKFLKTKS